MLLLGKLNNNKMFLGRSRFVNQASKSKVWLGRTRSYNAVPPPVQPTNNLTTVPKVVEFPPSGRRAYFFLSVLTLTYAVNEIAQFIQSRDRIEDLARRVKNGEGFFPASQVTRSLLELNAYAGEYESDRMAPSSIPRIMSLGGREGIIQGLQSENENVLNAAAELARTVTTCSPKAAKQLMQESPSFASALFSCVQSAVELNSHAPTTALEFHNADVLLPNLLSTVANCVQYYDLGRDAHLDQILTDSLSKLAKQTSAAARRHLNQEQINAEQGLLFYLDESAALNHQAWLLLITLRRPELGHDFLDEYMKLLPEQVFENEKQHTLFLLACFDHWKRNKITLHPKIQEEDEVLFKSSLGRKLLRQFLDHEDQIADGVSALFFGQVWGTLRTLFALRNVAVPAGEHSLMWRWKMSSRFGLTAGMGALAVTMLSHTLKHDMSMESDRAQLAAFSAKIMGSLFMCGFLFKLCPYFLVPAILADAVWNTTEYGVQESTQYVWDLTPFSSKPGKRGGDGSEWT